MFGGKGIYHNGLIVAIEIRGELMLKADAESAPEFAAAGCKQWTYTGSRHGKLVSMPYWTRARRCARRCRRDDAVGQEGLRGGDAGREVALRAGRSSSCGAPAPDGEEKETVRPCRRPS